MKTKAILLFTAAAFLLTLAPAISNAQFTKGSMLFEGALGNLSVTNNKSQDEQNGVVVSKSKNNGFSIGIMPRVGFFVTKDLVVGTTLGINFYSNKYQDLDPITGVKDGEAKSSSATLDFLPFVRYYFPGKNMTTRFYGQVGGGISLDLSNKYDSKNFDPITGAVTSTYKYNYPKKFNTISGEALVGLNHFISQNVAVNAALGYRYSTSKQTTTTTYTFGGTTNTSDPDKYTVKGGAFSWNVGFTMIIPCKKKK